MIISTGTKTLQDQLYSRDLPSVRSVLGARLKTALLKGRANYCACTGSTRPCAKAPLSSRTQAAQLATIRAWSARTRAATAMELAEVPEESPLWPRVTSTPENCLGVECPFFDDCHVVKARREAQEADVVVVNHHLLFADLALKQEGFGEILPGAPAFILDEAHQIPELAGQFFSQSISARQLTRTGAGCAGRMRGHHRCDRLAAGAGGGAAGCGAQGCGWRWMRCPRAARSSNWRIAPVCSEALHDAARTAGHAGRAARVAGRAFARLRQPARTRRSHCANGWIASSSAHGDERCALVRNFPRGFALYATPLDLALPMRALRERTQAAWIYTSATLSVAGDFDHFARQLGLDDPQTLSLESPFDYARQALCYLPKQLPDPNARDYTEQVIESRAAGAACLERARVPAVHFASRAASCGRAAAGQGAVAAVRAGHRAAAAAAGGVPRQRHGVLLGAASFWEGVDVVGEALSVVVIDKLPFAAPDDPVLMARLDALRTIRHQSVHGLAGAQRGDRVEAGRGPTDPRRARSRRAGAVRSAADHARVMARCSSPACRRCRARASWRMCRHSYARADMAKVIGFGGVFFKARDPKALRAWYAKHLGLDAGDFGAMFEEDESRPGCTLWTPFEQSTNHFAPSTSRTCSISASTTWMRCWRNCAPPASKWTRRCTTDDFGRFGWIMDSEGTRIELWQPPEN